MKHSSIRIILAIVAYYDLHVEKMDVKTTILHGELEERISMRKPERFKEKGKEYWVFLCKIPCMDQRNHLIVGERSLTTLFLVNTTRETILTVGSTTRRLQIGDTFIYYCMLMTC